MTAIASIASIKDLPESFWEFHFKIALWECCRHALSIQFYFLDSDKETARSRLLLTDLESCHDDGELAENGDDSVKFCDSNGFYNGHRKNGKERHAIGNGHKHKSKLSKFHRNSNRWIDQMELIIWLVGLCYFQFVEPGLSLKTAVY